MRKAPIRLPTLAEWDRLSRQEATEEVHESLTSVGEFLVPWPNEKTRGQLHSWADGAKFTIVWLTSRLDFVESLVGINEEWPMFSPNVSHRCWLIRARLTYADGSRRVVRGLADPYDLTHYSHWNQEKQLDHERKVDSDPGYEAEAIGWCNMLAHRYARNEAGSPLITITLYQVKIDYPPPGVDARAFLQKQMRLTEDRMPGEPRRPGDEDRQVYPDFYEVEVAVSEENVQIVKGRRLDDQ
jgi:hypothetical protein